MLTSAHICMAEISSGERYMTTQNRSNSPSDAELLRLAQSGKVSAFNALIVRYMRLVRLRSARMRVVGFEHEDLVQEGLIGFMAAVRTYVPGGSASFPTYASLLIDRSLINAARFAAASGRTPNLPLVSIDDDVLGAELSDMAGELYDPEAIYIANEAWNAFLSKARSLCTAMELQVMELYMAGRSYLQIAEMLGCNTKAIDNAMYRLRRKLKTAMH